MQPKSIRLPGADGLSLHALEWSTEGTALLFLHGFGNGAHVWDDIAPVVAPHYRTLALDLRGHGDSDYDPEGRYDHESMARDVEATVASLGIKRVVLVGHSLGGRISMHFAGRNGEKMAGLVIVDSGPDLDARGVTRIRLEVESADPSFASVAEYERVLLRQYPAARPETITKLAHHWLREREDGRFEVKLDRAFGRWRSAEDPERLRAQAREEAQQLWATLESLPCPALVIRGAASDVLSADTADRMADEVIPNGRLEVVPRAGHSVMLDNPDGFRDALTGFVLG